MFIETNLVKFDNCSMQQAIQSVKALSNSDGADYVVTPNVDHLARLTKEKTDKLIDIYTNASLCLCDSRVLEKMLRLKGHEVKEVIPGSTLTEKLFSSVLSSQDTILVVGSDSDVIDRVRAQYSHLKIDHYNPPMGFINNTKEVEKTLHAVQKSNANYVFLAVGSPRQEVLAAKIKEKQACNGVVLCIGASILFLVGEEKRAPQLFQTLHLEWAYRMMQDPKRLASRYFANFVQLPKLYGSL